MRMRSWWPLVVYAGSVCCQTAPPSPTVALPAAAYTLTLEQAIARAQAQEPAYASAEAERRATALERTSARAALLPTVTYHNLALYTQPNGVPTSRIGQTVGADSPIYIANNAIREYASQGVVDERLGLGQMAALRGATATALKAEAEAEIARRGLVLTVTSLFYQAQGAANRVGIAQQAHTEARRFLELTQAREQAREVAHADVLKAQLQEQQRGREVADTELAATRARLELGVLLFPDPSTPFTLDIPALPAEMPTRGEIERLAKQKNPEVRSASAALQLAQAATFSSRTALTPDLALSYTYGIDATNFGVNGPDGIHNLGYSVGATLDMPVWDWLTSERKIKASKAREGAAKVALSATQRRLLANLDEYYGEANLASQQLRSLEASVLTARESLRLTNLRYVDGESSALEVVDAQTAVTTAETAEVEGQLRYQVARAQLQTLTGKLPQ